MPIVSYIYQGSPDRKHNYHVVECSVHGVISSTPIGENWYTLSHEVPKIEECFYCNGDRHVPLPGLNQLSEDTK